MPFEELPHTADWCLRVWAPDLPTLFTEAARGMYSTAGIKLVETGRIQRTFFTTAPDAEGLLVGFLSELVFLLEKDHLAFDDIEVQVDVENAPPFRLSASLCDASVLTSGKAIKAVTYHNLNIHPVRQGLEVEIVFDV
jgi:SHS2 domain-containing protein